MHLRNETIDQSFTPPCQMCWVAVDVIILMVIFFGNALTVLALRLSRRLRSVISNRLVLSLAISDLIVGLAVTYHLFFYIDETLSATKVTCILRFVLLLCGCSASFLNLTTIAIDRYLAIIHPLKYPEYVTEKVASLALIVNWSCAIFISSIPIYWNVYDSSGVCEINAVIPRYCLIAGLIPFFLTVWLSIVTLYWKIWKEAKNHTQRLKKTGVTDLDSNQLKSVQVVLLILGTFSICWLPYVVVAVSQVLDLKSKPNATLYRIMFSVAMFNSAFNPIIYAWKNPSFRKAFYLLLRFESPNKSDYNASFKSYLKKQQELAEREVQSKARNESSSSELEQLYSKSEGARNEKINGNSV